MLINYNLQSCYGFCMNFPFYVKDCGMVEKKRAKRIKNVLQCPMC